MSRLDELQARRALLIAYAQRDRYAIASGLESLEVPLKIADAGWSGATWLRERPGAAGVVAALAVAIGARRGMRWMRFGLAAWQAWRWMSARRAQR
jgi:hypothetical protein